MCALLLTLLSGTAAAQSDSSVILHVGAKVRVKVPKLTPDWIPGTVVAMQRTANCLAVRLDRTDAQGRAQYAFFTLVQAMEVDRRTNQGVMVAGLPPARSEDWESWSEKEIAIVAKRCQR